MPDEAGAAAITCVGCGRTIADRYFEINGKPACEPCRASIEDRPAILRFLKSTSQGVAAAIAGGALYFAVMHALEMQAGPVSAASIACGALVGLAVRNGSGDRGGRIYQLLAVVLTYLSIGMACTGEWVSRGAFDIQVVERPGLPPVDQTTVRALKAYYVALSVVASPARVGKADAISLVLFAVALSQAWRITKRARWVVTGPFQVGEIG